MSEVKAIEAIDNALSGLAPDERTRVLGWAQAKYGASDKLSSESPSASAPSQMETNRAPIKRSSRSPGKSSKKPKTIIAMDKTLDLSPSGKKSAVQFGGDKSPRNAIQKTVVAVFYLRDIIELEMVTVEAVFTFFKTLTWPVPADLKNTLQQAGTAGYLDTSNNQNIKLTSLGENLVEHELPTKSK